MLKPVYSYLNYRDFLRDFFDFNKSRLKFYSYRLFSEKAGFKSPNFPKLVIDGQRNLTKESIFKISKATGLKKKWRTPHQIHLANPLKYPGQNSNL